MVGTVQVHTLRRDFLVLFRLRRHLLWPSRGRNKRLLMIPKNCFSDIRCGMFYSPASLLVIVSFFTTVPVVSFARSFAAENLDYLTTPDSAFTTSAILPDDVSSNDLFTLSLDETTNQMLDPGSIVSTELAADFLDPDAGSTFSSGYSVLGEENLMAENRVSGEMCPAEDDLSSPFIGRLRVRDSQPGNGRKLCGATPNKIGESDEGLDSFLESVPQVFAPTDPGIRERRDICPPEQYENRNYPVCSSGNPDDEHITPGFFPGTTEIALVPAYPCRS